MASDQDGRYEITILDGSEASQDVIRIPMKSIAPRRNRCELRGIEDDSYSSNVCPNGDRFTANLKLNPIRGRAEFVRVGVVGSISYADLEGARAPSASAVRAQCAFPVSVFPVSDRFPDTMYHSGVLNGFLGALVDPVRTLPNITQLRRDRWAAYRSLNFTQEELNQINGTSLASIVALAQGEGMAALGLLSRSGQLQEQFMNTPQRRVASQRLNEIQAQLNALYDPSAALSIGAKFEKVASELVPNLDQAIKREVTGTNAHSVTLNQLLSFELVSEGIKRCSSAISDDQNRNLAASQAVHQALMQRGPEIASRLQRLSTQQLTSTEMTNELGLIRTSQGARAALAQTNQVTLLDTATTRLATLLVNEQRARDLVLAQQRAAAQREQARREASARAARQSAKAAAAAREAKLVAGLQPPNSKEIRDTLLTSMSSLRLAGGMIVYEMFGFAQTIIDLDNGTYQNKILGMDNMTMQVTVSNPRCTRVGRQGAVFSCTYVESQSVYTPALTQLTGISLMNAPSTATRTERMEYSNGRWTSRTMDERVMRALASSGGGSSRSSSSNDSLDQRKNLCRGLNAGMVAAGGTSTSAGLNPSTWGC